VPPRAQLRVLSEPIAPRLGLEDVPNEPDQPTATHTQDKAALLGVDPFDVVREIKLTEPRRRHSYSRHRDQASRPYHAWGQAGDKFFVRRREQQRHLTTSTSAAIYAALSDIRCSTRFTAVHDVPRVSFSEAEGCLFEPGRAHQ